MVSSNLHMDFHWYETIQQSDDITQGDLIDSCPIPIPNKSMFLAIIESQEEVVEPIEVKQGDVVVLSQACDILNEKIDSIVVCPRWPLSKLIEENSYFKGSKARESLRQGKEPSYHLLNQFTSDTISTDFSVVDFHHIYSLPKEYLKNIVSKKESRLRLLPPYREHLSQAFARYFMRVGLPLDIDSDSIKNYSA